MNALFQADLHGSPYIGVFGAANSIVALLPPSSPPLLQRQMGESLQCQVLTMTIGGSNVLGALVAMNSRGVVVADIATEDEMAQLRKLGLKVGMLEGKLNAAGNNVLCTDQGALVHPEVTMRQIDVVGDVLGLERVETGTIGGIETVGSAAVATSNGVLCHPRLSAREKAHVEDVLGVSSNIGTVNHGTPFIGAGLVANSKGAAIGRMTTGPEMNRIEDALGYI